MLEISGLRAGYGGLPVLDGLGLHVDEGEFVAIVGPNGAGKTTLFKAISGIVTPTAGSPSRLLWPGACIRGSRKSDSNWNDRVRDADQVNRRSWSPFFTGNSA